MDFLKNMVINLRATGPAAVLIAWIAGVTFLGLFGKGGIAGGAIGILAIIGFPLIKALGQHTEQKIKDQEKKG